MEVLKLRNGIASHVPAPTTWPGDRHPAIVVGLNAEARLARRLGVPVFIGGGTAAGAEAASRRAITAGADALVSLGLAGGLDPTLRPGALLVPEAVLSRGQSIATDVTLSRWLGGTTPLRILGADGIAADATAKHLLWQDSGAAALDLESGAVARAAVERSLPFAVLRVICDPAERDLPPAALAALDSLGAIGLARVLASVLAHPGQMPALRALAADAATARRALARWIAAIMADRPSREGPVAIAAPRA